MPWQLPRCSAFPLPWPPYAGVDSATFRIARARSCGSMDFSTCPSYPAAIASSRSRTLAYAVTAGRRCRRCSRSCARTRRISDRPSSSGILMSASNMPGLCSRMAATASSTEEITRVLAPRDSRTSVNRSRASASSSTTRNLDRRQGVHEIGDRLEGRLPRNPDCRGTPRKHDSEGAAVPDCGGRGTRCDLACFDRVLTNRNPAGASYVGHVDGPAHR